MATFLVTPRMNPALAARVERAVSDRRRARHHASALGLKGTFAAGEGFTISRLWPIAVALLLGAAAAALIIADRRALEADRRSLLSALTDARATFPAGHEGFIAGVDRWIVETAGDEGAAEVIDPALRPKGALDAWLRRPAVYLRGPIADLRDPLKIDEAAKGSGKDAFLLCLLIPPPSTSERDLLNKVRGVYFDGAKVDEETAGVRRLAEARAGLALIAPVFEGWVRAAPDQRVLAKLRRELTAAPLSAARRAAAAESLLVVTDGPAREARVALIDLAGKKVMARLRLGVEEQGNSPQAALHREQLEGCSVAVAARRRVEGE